MSRQPFGVFLRQLRQLKGLSQQQVADGLDVKQSAVSKWEKADRVMDVNFGTLDKLATLYGLAYDQLIKQWERGGIPLVNAAAAGAALDAPVDHYDERRAAGAFVDGEGEGVAAIPVKGDSMEPELRDGDTVIARAVPDDDPALQPRERQIVVAHLSQDAPAPGAIIGRWQPLPDGSILIGKDNSRRAPLIVQREHIERLCVVVEVRRKPR